MVPEVKMTTGPAFTHPFAPPEIAWLTLSPDKFNQAGLNTTLGDMPQTALERFMNLDLKTTWETAESRTKFENSVRGIHKRLMQGTYDEDPAVFFSETREYLHTRHNRPALEFVLLDLGLTPLHGDSWASAQPNPSRKVKRKEIANALMVADLVRAIEGNGKPCCNEEDGRWTIEMVHSIYQAQKTGNRVTFPLQSRTHPLESGAGL